MPYADRQKRIDYLSERYKTCRNKHIAQVHLCRSKRRKRIREFLTYCKSKPCSDCGDFLNPWQMDFDHRDTKTKKFTIGNTHNLDKSIKELKEEISKCDIVCANCHRNRTHLKLQFLKNQ